MRSEETSEPEKQLIAVSTDPELADEWLDGLMAGLRAVDQSDEERAALDGLTSAIKFAVEHVPDWKLQIKKTSSLEVLSPTLLGATCKKD